MSQKRLWLSTPLVLFCLNSLAVVLAGEVVEFTVEDVGKTDSGINVGGSCEAAAAHGITASPCCEGVCRHPGHPAKPKCKKPGDRNWSDCPPKRYRMCNCKRAGRPRSVASWADCSVDQYYSGSYVGGGAAIGGRSRNCEEGTWGLDYDGLFHPTKFFMRWTCGRKQGGEGAYETDGEPDIRIGECRPDH